MSTQVVRLRTKFQMHDSRQYLPQFDLTFQQQGTDATVNYVDIEATLISVLNSTPTGATHSLGYYLGYGIAMTEPFEWEFTDITAHLNGSAAGSPVRTGSNAWTDTRPSGGNSLPDQIAAVWKFRADYGSDTEVSGSTRPRSRDRNRVFLGPLNEAASTTDPTTGRFAWSTVFGTDLPLAMAELLTIPSSGAGDTTRQVQWSRANAAVKNITVTALDSVAGVRRKRARDHR